MNVMAYKLLINDSGKKQRMRTYDEAKEIITQPCTYWADELAIKYIEKILKIGIIIFDMTPRKNGYYIADTVILLEDGKRYKIADLNNSPEGLIYTLEGKDGNRITNITADKLSEYPENILSKFRIDYSLSEFDDDIKDFIFIAKTSIEDEAGHSSIHYELVRNTGIGMYVYNFSQIPEYIKYFIYEKYYRYIKPDIRDDFGYSRIKAFNDLFKEYENKMVQEQRKDGLDVEDIMVDVEDPLIAEFDDINQKILENSAALDNLKSIEDPDDTIMADIERTTNMINELKTQLEVVNASLLQKFGQSGGQEKRPNEQYYEYMNPFSYQQNYQQNPYYQQNYYPIPRPAYPYQMGYPSKPINYSNYTNKMKETSSKTAYYIDIDLELFPGKNITVAQKLQSKCQTNFENIREAYANLFGYEYRPSEMSNAYAYQAKIKEEKDKKRQKEEQTRKNEKYNQMRSQTQKNR
jgi:hypothetical protein